MVNITPWEITMRFTETVFISHLVICRSPLSVIGPTTNLPEINLVRSCRYNLLRSYKQFAAVLSSVYCGPITTSHDAVLLGRTEVTIAHQNQFSLDRKMH